MVPDVAGRLLARSSAHDIIAAHDHTALARADKYTREANRRRGKKDIGMVGN
jgi:hypothetical protein